MARWSRSWSWRRRESNPHRRSAEAASFLWTTSPKKGWCDGPDGNRTRLDPARQAGGIPRCLRDLRGDHRDANPDQEVHSLPCEPLHHGHHQSLAPLATLPSAGAQQAVRPRSAGESNADLPPCTWRPAALPLCYGQMIESGWADSNRRPPAPEAGALPAALHPVVGQPCGFHGLLVWVAGIEPAAASFQARLSTSDLHPERIGAPCGSRTRVGRLKAGHPAAGRTGPTDRGGLGRSRTGAAPG